MTSNRRSARVLVTGGSRGIGRAIVLECAARGADVVLTYQTNHDRASQTQKEARALGVCADVIPLDMGDRASVDEFEQVIAKYEALDAAVLNAGAWVGGRIESLDADTWANVIAVNLNGTYLVTKALLPLLKSRPDASITVMSSVIALRGFEGDTAYSAAKGGLISFGKSLAKELAGDGLRVNVVAPGFIETDMTAAVSDRAWSRLIREVPLGRAGTPEEIARAVSFLIFDGTYMTGSVLTVDGGWSGR